MSKYFSHTKISTLNITKLITSNPQRKMTLFFKAYTSPTSTSSSWKKTFISILIASFVLSHSSGYVSAQVSSFIKQLISVSDIHWYKWRIITSFSSTLKTNASNIWTSKYPKSAHTYSLQTWKIIKWGR